jgi:hypothetical protein
MSAAPWIRNLIAWALLWVGFLLIRWGFEEQPLIAAQRAVPIGAGFAGFAALIATDQPRRRAMIFAASALVALFTVAWWDAEVFAPGRAWWVAISAAGAAVIVAVSSTRKAQLAAPLTSANATKDWSPELPARRRA